MASWEGPPGDRQGVVHDGGDRGAGGVGLRVVGDDLHLVCPTQGPGGGGGPGGRECGLREWGWRWQHGMFHRFNGKKIIRDSISRPVFSNSNFLGILDDKKKSKGIVKMDFFQMHRK